jgi:hypothetical protein
MCYANENKFMNLCTVNYVFDVKNGFTLGYYVNAFHLLWSVKQHLKFKCCVETWHYSIYIAVWLTTMICYTQINNNSNKWNTYTMPDCTTISLLLTHSQYISMPHLYKSHNEDIQCAQLLIFHLPFKTGAPSLSVIKIQWRPSTLKRIRNISVIQDYISMFHSAYTLRQGKLKVKEKLVEKIQTQVTWLCLLLSFW